MNYTQFISAFERHIATLSFEEQLSLAISVCKKLAPDYQSFAAANDFGNFSTLMNAISICESARTHASLSSRIDSALSEMDAITPDMDDFGDWDSSYALNACTATTDTLEFIRNRDKEHILSVGIYLIDTVDFKIQERAEREGKPELSEAYIDEHPLMKEAREFLLAKPLQLQLN